MTDDALRARCPDSAAGREGEERKQAGEEVSAQRSEGAPSVADLSVASGSLRGSDAAGPASLRPAEEGLRAVARRMLKYRAHRAGCEVEMTEFCTCGMKEAANDLRTALSFSGAGQPRQVTAEMVRAGIALVNSSDSNKSFEARVAAYLTAQLRAIGEVS